MGLPVVSGVAWQVCIWNADITKWWVESYQSLGVGGRQFDELVTVVDTVGCLDDNLWCHQWWRGCRTGDVLLSVMVILNMFFLYVYFVSGCNKAFIYLIYLYLITVTECTPKADHDGFSSGLYHNEGDHNSLLRRGLWAIIELWGKDYSIVIDSHLHSHPGELTVSCTNHQTWS